MLLFIILHNLFYYCMSDQYLYIILITWDNLILSYNTICDIYNINYKIIFYHTSNYIDRYIYYIGLILIKNMLYILCYGYYNMIISYMLFLSLIPIIFKYILNYMQLMNDYIKKKVYNIMKLLLYDIIKYIIKIICLTSINHDPCLNNKEIKNLLKKNYKQLILTLLRNFVLLTIIKTLSYGNTISLNIIRKIYNANAEYKYVDPYPDIDKDKQKIIKLINQRQWDMFFNPYMIDLLINIYEKSHDNTILQTNIEYIFSNIELSIAKIFTTLSIIKILYMYNINIKYLYMLIGLVSMLLIPVNKWHYKLIIIRCIAIIIGYNYNNFLLCSIICEFAELLFTNFYIWLIKHIDIYIKKNNYILIHNNIYNYYIIINIIFLGLYQYIPFSLIFLLYNILNSKYPIITLWFVFFGQFSDYFIIHLLILGFLLYFTINIINIKNAPKPKLQIQYMPNYNKPKPLLIKNNYILPSINKPKNKLTNIPMNDLPNYKEPIININILNLIHNPNYNIIPR